MTAYRRSMTSDAWRWPPEPDPSLPEGHEPDWRRLRGRLDDAVAPLRDAAWMIITEPISDRGGADNDPSVAYDLQRGDQVIEVE